MITRRDVALRHPVRAALTQLRDVLAADPPDASDIAAVAGLRESVAYLIGRINATPATLVAASLLDDLGTQATAAITAGSQYFAGVDPSALATANTHVDAALRAVGLPVTVRAESSQLRTYAGAIEDDLARAAAQFARGVAESEAGQTAILAAVESSENRLIEASTQMQAEWQAALASAMVELNAVKTELAAQQGRLDAAIAAFQQQFSNAEAARAVEAVSTQSTLLQDSTKVALELQTKAAQTAEALQSDADETSANLAQTSNSILAQLAKQLSDAKLVASKVGAIGMSDGYGEYAKQQQRSARNWNMVVAGAFAAAFVVTGAFVIELIVSGVAALDIERVLERVLIGLPLYVLAAYAASQALRHRDQEQEARRRELEIASLDPFLALLEKDKQDELKATIALRYFGKESPIAPEGLNQAKLTEGVIEILKEVAKKG
jgi:hypothetical protein